MDIRSDVGRGTTVTIYLPRNRAPARKSDERTAAPIPQSRPLRILLVEDNPQVAEVATAILTERGHSIIHAETADEALGMLHSGVTFDLAFSDLVMPGKHDGLGLARIIRRKWPALPILLATGYSEAASRATEEGFTLIAKPYQAEALANALQKVVTSHPLPEPTNVIRLTKPQR